MDDLIGYHLADVYKHKVTGDKVTVIFDATHLLNKQDKIVSNIVIYNREGYILAKTYETFMDEYERTFEELDSDKV